MRMQSKTLAKWAVPIVLVLVGCTQQRAVLELEPKVVQACALPIALHVQWDATALGLRYAKLESSNLGKKPKVWVVGDAKGEQSTGVWAWDGYTITLKSMNDVVLARRTLTTVPCQ